MAKKIQLRKRLSEDTEYYDQDVIEKYIDFLEEKGRLERVGNLLLDAQALSRPFACDTTQCVSCGKTGRGRKKLSSCCEIYTPRLSTRERECLDSILPVLYKRFPRLQKTIEKAGGYYEWDEGYDRMVNKGDNGLCVFMTPDTNEFGFHACKIHAWCLETGKSPFDYKPSACVMFPLFLLDTGRDDGTILLSVHSREIMTMGETDDGSYQEVGCLKAAKADAPPVYREMRTTLENMFGVSVWKQMDQVLKKQVGQP
jgi:hypothetical protein